MMKIAKAAYWGVAYAVWLIVGSSYLFLFASGLWDRYPYTRWLAWFVYFWYARSDPTVRMWLWISGLPVALTPALMAGMVFYQRRYYQGWMMVLQGRPAAPWSKQPQVPTHGDASFARASDMIDKLRGR